MCRRRDLVLDHDGYLPCFGIITTARWPTSKPHHQMHFTSGTIVVDDRGYNDYRLFAQWTDAGVYFVTRMKDNALFEVVEEREPPQNRGILTDQIIRLTGPGAKTALLRCSLPRIQDAKPLSPMQSNVRYADRISQPCLQHKIDDRLVRDKSLQKPADIKFWIAEERTLDRLIKYFSPLKRV